MRSPFSACMASAIALSTWLASPVAGQSHIAPRRIQVAEGIHLFVTPPYGDVGLDGNSIAIVSSDGVLVFDANGTPAAASAVLAEIRKLTNQPVRYLVLSHWHWDHWYGAEVYKKAFPALQIIGHEKARALMAGPALEFNRPGLERDLPGYVAALESKVRDAEMQSAPPPNLDALRERVATARFFLDQKRKVEHTLPNVTFEHKLDLYFGGRHVQLLHHDRAVTPGDTFLYLRNERIVVTGDLLVNPVSFALSCYPTGWLQTLQRIDALDATTIVPGHGEPMRDKDAPPRAHRAVRATAARGQGGEGEGARPRRGARRPILPKLQAVKSRITRDDPTLDDQFRVYLVDWFLHRVYDELAGPLTDDIARIPAK